MTNKTNITNKNVIARSEATKQSHPLIPELRFKEFDVEWDEKRLGELGSIVSGLTYSPKDIVEKGTLVLRSSNIQSGILSFDDNVYVNVAKFNPVEEDDVLICVRNGSRRLIGKNAIIDKKNIGHAFGAFMTVFRSKLNKFLYYFFDTEDYKKEVHKNLGATINSINGNELKKFKVHIPTLPEQQKIAHFLTAVDTKLQQLTQKKELLEQFKKGVMQQLFSQQLHFKPNVIARTKDEAISSNEAEYPDWEEKKLGEVGKIVSGLTYSPNDIVENEEGVLVLRSSNVQGRKLHFEDNVYVKVKSFNPVQENDVLICVRNGSKRLIGKNAKIDKKFEGLAFGAFMTVYRSDFNNFLFHYFDSKEYKKEVHRNLGATINSINGSDLKKFKIPFPSKEEQQKIANYLSAIDTKIETVSQQITQTQQFKKGLLQQMFV